MTMDKCKCWGTSQITISIEHCPSLNAKVRDEIDKITRFAREQTQLHNYGKLKCSECQEAQRSPNDVSSLPDKA